MPDFSAIIPVTANCVLGRPETIDVPQGGTLADMLAMTGLQPYGLHVFLNDRLIPHDWYGTVRPKAGDRVFIAIVPMGGGDESKVWRSIAMIGVAILSIYTYGLAGGGLYGALAAGAVSMGGGLLVNALIPPATASAGVAGTSSIGGTVEAAYSITGSRNQVLPFKTIPKTLGTDRVYPPYHATPYTHVKANKQYVYMLFCLGRGPLNADTEKFGDSLISDLDASAEIHYGTGANLPAYFNNNSISQEDMSVLLDATGTDHTGVTPTILTTSGEADRVEIEFYANALYWSLDANQMSVVPTQGFFGPVMANVEIKYRVVGTSTWVDTYLGDGWDDTLLWSDGTILEGNYVRLLGWTGKASRYSVSVKLPSTAEYEIRLIRTRTQLWPPLNTAVIADVGDDRISDDLYVVALRTILNETPDIPDDIELVSVMAMASDKLNNVPDDFNLMVYGIHPGYVLATRLNLGFDRSAGGFTATNGVATLDNKFVKVAADRDNYLIGADNMIIVDATGDRISYVDMDWTFARSGIVLAGATDYTIKMRYRLVGYSAAINNRLRWSTGSHGFSDSYYMAIPMTTPGQWETVELDMRTPTAGGSDWTGNSITGLQFYFESQEADEYYEIDYLQVFISDTSGWGQYQTSNPAWIFAEILTGSANHRACDLAKLDETALRAWATQCIVNGYEYNATVSGRSLVEMMRVVCAAGRATWDITQDGRYSVIYDDARTDITQVISARNSWGFRGSKGFDELPHCLVSPFRDKDNGYVPGERRIYRDGYSAANATLFETMEFDGQVDAEMVYKFGRYYFAQAILRPENFEVYLDWEYLTTGRGERVRFAHDVPLIGSGSMRIKTIAIAGLDVTLTVDDVCTFEAGKTYAILIRVIAGNPIAVGVDHPGAGEFTQLTTTLAAAESVRINTGDLLVFGESDGYYEDLIVRTIEPAGDDTAKISLVPYNPDIYDDATVYGTIPEYDTVISQPVDKTRLPPPVPSFLSIVSDESVLVVQADGTIVSRMIAFIGLEQSGSTITAATIQCQYRLNDDYSPWISAPDVDAAGGQVIVSPVRDLAEYAIQIRSISYYGVKSAWVSTTHTVVGKTAPPPQVQDFEAAIIDNQIELKWSHVTVADRKDYELRYGSVTDDWSTATFIGRTDSTSFRTPARWIGARLFFIKAIDTSDNYSVSATTADYTIIAPSVSGITTSVIDNNVLFKWINVAGSLPVDHVEIRKGDDYATAVVVGEKKGTFTTVFENMGGTYKYWIVAIDTAGNYGTPVSVSVIVDEPPDYVLNRLWAEDFADGTATNVFVYADGTAIAPANTTETWAGHFTDNGWTCIQDAIDDGAVYFIEPVPLTAAYAEEFDYEAVLTSSKVTVSLDTTDYNGGPTVTTWLAEKKLAGDSYNETETSSTYFYDFQYVRDRFAFVSDGASFAVLRAHTIRLDAKLVGDAGNDTVSVAADGADVLFNKVFADITSITVTPAATTAVIAVYDFADVPNPTGFTVYLFDTDGNPVTGDFSWKVEGF